MSGARWGIPDSWRWVDVDSIADVVGGGTPSAGDPDNFSEDGISWLTPADLSRNRAAYVTGGSRFLSQRGYDNSGAQLLPKGAVLFSSRAPIGYCAIAANPLCTNQGFKSLVLRDGLAPEYVRHYLLASKDYAEAEASGTTFLELSGARMKTLSVPVAPIAEQKRIVAKVEELTARSRRAKEALDAVPPLLDQLRQSILAAAFRGDLTAAGTRTPGGAATMARVRREHEALRSNRKKTEEVRPADWAELPNLPIGWSWERADHVVEPGTVVTYGIVLPGKHVQTGVPYIRGQDIENGEILVEQLLRTTPEIAQVHGRSALKAGDILLCIIRHLKVALVPAGLDGANITQGTVRMRPSAAIVGRYLAYYLSSVQAQNWMKARYFGLAMPRINVEDAREIPVPVPPVDEQNKIVAAIDACVARLREIETTTEAARRECSRLSQSILSKAFRGELVPQDPNDEPASILLGRLRASRDIEPGATPKQPRRSRSAERVSATPNDNDHEREVSPSRPDSPTAVSKDAREIEPQSLQNQVAAALWTLGPLEKNAAVRRVADHLRQAGHIQFERLRADGPLFAQVLDAIEAAVKSGRLDRPMRGHVRACKPDATTYTPDDWRHALVASLGTDPVDRDDAIRSAAEWARANLGLEFARLREDGHIVEGLRSALNSAIRRGDIIRHDAKLISRKS